MAGKFDCFLIVQALGSSASIFGRPVNRGLEAETVLGAGNIVIHGFRDAPDGHALRRQHRSEALGVVITDNDQAIEFQKAHILQDFVRQIDALFRLASFTIRGEMGRQAGDFDIVAGLVRAACSADDGCEGGERDPRGPNLHPLCQDGNEAGLRRLLARAPAGDSSLSPLLQRGGSVKGGTLCQHNSSAGYAVSEF